VDARLTAALAFSIGLVAACKVPNLDHCLHKATDANAWCEEEHPELPFCSPCEAENNGCVDTEPTEEGCPEYTPDSTGGSDTVSGTGDESGSTSGSTTASATATGTQTSS